VVKVLDRLQNSPQVLTAAPLKALRARLHALAAATGARGGEQREQLAAVRAGHKAKNRKLQQQRAHDREFINNTALRDGRLKVSAAVLSKEKIDVQNALARHSIFTANTDVSGLRTSSVHTNSARGWGLDSAAHLGCSCPLSAFVQPWFTVAGVVGVTGGGDDAAAGTAQTGGC
jgi:hypothetical protein